MGHLRIPEAPIPVTIIGGHLGAGKTTLVNHLLEQGGGRRFAVIVNEFGGISGGVRAPPNTEVVLLSLSRGCICCGRTTEFVMALARALSAPRRPDQVLVEASGVSDLSSVAEHARLRGLRLDATVVVADAAGVRAQAAEPNDGGHVRRQLRAADLIVLNKADLVTATERASIHAWLLTLTSRPRVVEASFGRIRVSLVVPPWGDATPTAPAHTGDPGLEAFSANQTPPPAEAVGHR